MYISIIKKIFFILLIIILNKQVYADDKMNLGQEIYNNKAMCGTCHTLKAAQSCGEIGPNLDQIKPSIETIIYTVTNGIGVMQAWEGIITKEEIEAVAYFVFNKINK